MSATNANSVHRIGEDVLGSSIDANTGTILLQLGDVVDQEASSSEAELWGPCGFASRPANPTPGKAACQVIAIAQSDRDICTAARDVRKQSVYGGLKAGETAVFATEGQARAILKADGSISLITTQGNAEGAPMMILSLDPAKGFVLTTPWGGLSIGPNGVQIYSQSGSSAGGTLLMTPSGTCTLSGPTCNIAGGNVSLGIGAVAANGCAYSITGPANVVSTSVFVAP